MVEADRYGYAFLAVVVSVLTLAMYMKVMKYAFLEPSVQGLQQITRVPLLMNFSMIVLAFICVTGGILFVPNVNAVFLNKASDVLYQGLQYAQEVLGSIT